MFKKTPSVRGTYQTYIEVSGSGFDLEIPVDIEYRVEAFDPGKTYGPPELCYPPEGGEVEVQSIRCDFSSQIMEAIRDSAEFGDLCFEIQGDAREALETSMSLQDEAKMEEMRMGKY